MKRFWTKAEAVFTDGAWIVRLDDRPMRLPGGPFLKLESRMLAEAIAEEWQAAGATMQAEDVPLTRIAGTAQERVAPDPAPTVEALVTYGANDLLCYAPASPAELVQLQAAAWQPWLDWVAQSHGATLVRGVGVMPVEQPGAALAALRSAVGRHPPFELAGLGVLVPALGSLVLGLAVADEALDATEAHRLALLDELFQAEKWGEDREAAARRAAVAHDVSVAARFIALSRAAG